MPETEFGACPIPGHTGIGCVDSCGRDLVLWCDCLGAPLWGGGRAQHHYALSDAFFAVDSGTGLDRGFRFKYRLAARLLLDVELGLIEPAHVYLPTVEVSDLAQRALELYRRLYAAQVGAGWPDPGGLAVGLVRAWLRCSQEAAHHAIKELVAAGAIVRSGKLDRMFLYRPGVTQR
jgi:hypothetical protein